MSSYVVETGRYRTLHELLKAGETFEFLPVRITVGKPRFISLEMPAVYLLAPYGLFKKPPLPTEEFQVKYRARLDRHGPEKIGQAFQLLHDEYQRPLRLLCYEDVKAGQSCHRRMFAEWWEEKTGQVVPEA